jgi:hypothetical protein
MSISYVENGDSGLTARTLINQAIDGVNSGSLPYTGSAQITGSLIIDGTTTSTLGFTGSLQGTATSASYVLNAISASFASTASYVVTAQTASYVITAQTASYVLNAISASYATTASYALNGGGGGSTDTGSLLMTASVSLNTITFTKGNGTTFPITVDTGSGGGGGSTFPYTGSAIISGSLEVIGSLKLVNAGDISNDGLLYYDGKKGVVNDPEFTLRASTITGGTSGTIDLSNLGTTAGCKGLILPLTAPGEPAAGSTYFQVGPNLLWVFDGSQWVSTELRP